VQWLERFDQEVGDGDLAAALITALKGTETSPTLAMIPRFVLKPLIRRALKQDERDHGSDDAPLKQIIPTMRLDVGLVKETQDEISKFKSMNAEVLLLGGSKSPGYFKIAIRELEGVLPCARHVELKGLDHLGPDNSGRPQVVAAELKRFFMQEREAAGQIGALARASV
jgi:hypothetical protein